MGFKDKLSKYFFSNGITYFFLVILIEIFILKTTCITSVHLNTKNSQKKNVKKCYYSMFHFALNIGGIAILHVIICICFSSYLNLVITFFLYDRKMMSKI
jgi:hypothetical protein